MYVTLDHDIYTTNAIKLYLLIFVVAPVAHSCHVFSVRLVLLVAYSTMISIDCDSCCLLAEARLLTLGENDVLIQSGSELAAVVRLLP